MAEDYSSDLHSFRLDQPKKIKVGSYEMGRLYSCPHCKKDEFTLYESVSWEELYRDLSAQEPWKCKKCLGESWEPPNYHAKQFKCPYCSQINTVVIEPSEICPTHKIYIHDSNTVECIQCTSEFDTSVKNELRQASK